MVWGTVPWIESSAAAARHSNGLQPRQSLPDQKEQENMKTMMALAVEQAMIAQTIVMAQAGQ